MASDVHPSVEVELPVWRDRKRYLWLLGLIPASATFISWGIFALFGMFTPTAPFADIWWWGGPIIVYILIPLIDLAAGVDGKNPPDELVEALENDRYYRWCTYAYIPLQYAGLITACYLWTRGGMDVIDRFGLAFTVAATAGIGINTAHELGHKKQENERWLSKVVLAQSAYGHFYIEHNRGHHVRVATPEDPASSRFGETFYRFWPRSVAGSFASAWRLEQARFERLGTSPWSIKNDVLNAWLMTVVLFGALIAIFGIEIAPWLVIQAVLGFTFLEAVNYLEHYGLGRQKTPSGRYERAAPRHSWNSDHVVTNVFLYHLQRHSDHHANPTRRYQALRSMEEAPQLPAGYASMILLAYIPPLWRRVMDHRVVEHYGGDITLANIDPRKRAKVLAEYGVSQDPQVGAQGS